MLYFVLSQKSALVWSPVAAAATAGCHNTALPQPGRPHSVSPASPATPAVTSMATNSGVTGLPWMSVMTDPHHHHHHPLSMSSAATHPNFNMWNGGVDIKPCLADLNVRLSKIYNHFPFNFITVCLSVCLLVFITKKKILILVALSSHN